MSENIKVHIGLAKHPVPFQVGLNYTGEGLRVSAPWIGEVVGKGPKEAVEEVACGLRNYWYKPVWEALREAMKQSTRQDLEVRLYALITDLLEVRVVDDD